MAAIGTWAVATGQITYVVTEGVSMNPVYYRGDLVFVVKASDYRIGEIAAYRPPGARVKVLHRIVAGDPRAGFAFKGDNNQSTDSFRPRADQVLGRAALHIPRGGVWLKPVLSPIGLGMMGFLIVSGGAAVPRNRRELPRGRRRKRVKAMARQGGPGAAAMTVVTAVRRMPARQQSLAFLVALLALSGLALGILGWMKPTVRAAINPGQSMVFSYSASVPRSAAYDGTVAMAPDPIFRRLAQRVELRMQYRGQPGTFSADAAVSTGNGWHTTVPLITPSGFTGRSYTARITLDLRAIDARARAAAKAIGVAVDTVTIAVSARVRGATDFTAPLRLVMTPQALSLIGGAATLAVNSPDSESTTVVARRVGFLTAAAARSWAVFLMIVAAGGAVAVFVLSRRSAGLRTRAEIERRYPQLLVHVEPMTSPPGKPVVNVDNFPALVRLAERYGQMILTWRRPDADDFVVRDEGITYRYRVLLEEPTLQNVELIDRPSGVGSHRRRAASEVS